MQVQSWDQVMVMADEHEGRAGIVEAVDNEYEIAQVKLDGDELATPIEFALLKLLGR
jgi:hypothetical protein